MSSQVLEVSYTELGLFNSSFGQSSLPQASHGHMGMPSQSGNQDWQNETKDVYPIRAITKQKTFIPPELIKADRTKEKTLNPKLS